MEKGIQTPMARGRSTKKHLRHDEVDPDKLVVSKEFSLCRGSRDATPGRVVQVLGSWI